MKPRSSSPSSPSELPPRPSCGPGEVRCGCGSLLAKVIGQTVELKCRRCKQTWRIPLEGA